MGSMLDVVGGIILFGVLLLMTLQLNIFTAETAVQQNLTAYNQERITGNESGLGLGGMVEYDLAQVGYGDSLAPSVTVADTNRVTFRADIDGNGSVDSIKYYVTTPASIPPGGNPNLKYLYRKQNTETGTGGWVGVSQFKITYLDNMGRIIPTPVAGTSLSDIRSIRIQMTVESATRMKSDWDTTFASSYWETLISPSNIK
jgi:hypothetical protein